MPRTMPALRVRRHGMPKLVGRSTKRLADGKPFYWTLMATVAGVLVEVSVVLSAGKVCSRTWKQYGERLRVE